jgi:two-component system, OmpR family, phosphate regulon response regulator PhoB
MKNTVLIVDDEQDVLRLVESNLKRAGYDTIVSKDGRHALGLARSEKPDLMILDLMLPTMSGLEVCRALKGDSATANLPILMLTARHEEIDRVVGFELGADDYVTKPFSPRELVLRVQSLLRRCGNWQRPQGSKPGAGQESGVLKTGDITLDHNRCEVRVGGRSIGFSPTEFKLLAILAQQPGRVLSREKLLTEVWGYENDTETRTVDMHVLRVREKLGRAADCLETVRGFGYRITSPRR